MFTGIVEEIGAIRAIERGERLARLEVEARITLDGVDIGGSVAVNGVCLTVIERRPSGFVFEIGPETLSRTALGRLTAGDSVNLERPCVSAAPWAAIWSWGTSTVWEPWTP